MSAPTNEQREQAEEKPLRMDAYYYGFERTNVLAVDRVLSAVASAGKGYHNTEDWNNVPRDNGLTPVEKIQAAANAAAAELSAALSRIEELAKERDAANAILEELETLTGFTQTALVDEWLCVSKDAARLDWIEQSLREDVDPRTVYEEPWDEHTPLRDYIDRGMAAASSSGANTP